MAKVRITQIKSGIKHPKDQKATLLALGITKMQRPVEKEITPAVQGMINKVAHLLKVENI
jgi:large subunit ribosomal protein L30